MAWLEISIEATPFGREILRAVLENQQIRQSEDLVGEEEAFRALKNTAEDWDYVDEEALSNCRDGIRFYLPDSDEGRSQLENIQRQIERIKVRHSFADDPGSWKMIVTAKQDEDWHQIWKSFFRGFPVGKSLFVKPCWEDSDEKDWGQRKIVQLEVGGSFGTGDHASTRLCLEWLEAHGQQGMSVLDVGCGSGILFIAALLLGAEKALALDIDPHAVAEAKRNARLNGLEPGRYRVIQADIFDRPDLNICGDAPDGSASSEENGAVDREAETIGPACFLGKPGADLLIANVTADVIISLMRCPDTLIKPGGVFLASGIIDSRWPEVERCLGEQGFDLLWQAQSRGWVAVAGHYYGKK